MVWIIIGAVVLALAVYAFWPRRSTMNPDIARLNQQNRAHAHFHHETFGGRADHVD